jgi:major membrane immunogen (membrane-anchored lipoprotein)
MGGRPQVVRSRVVIAAVVMLSLLAMMQAEAVHAGAADPPRGGAPEGSRSVDASFTGPTADVIETGVDPQATPDSSTAMPSFAETPPPDPQVPTAGGGAQPSAATDAGSISGTVVADTTGTPLAGICAYPFPPGGGTNVGSSGPSAADGTYVTTGVPVGTYRVRFQDCAGPIEYAAEYYDNTLSFSSALLVSVSANTTTSGINAGLAIGGSISGTVVADSNGAPLANICVSAPLASTGSSIFRVTTPANGTYLITGLAAGTYKVRFEDCVAPVEYAQEYYDNRPDLSSANTVSVTAGATTSGINAGVAAAGSISGTVVADGTGAPLAGICVSPFPPGGGNGVGSATTAADGTYVVAGVAVGTWRVRFQDCVSPIDYAAEYYDNTLDFNSTLVSVSAGATTSNINAGLAISGSISGTVMADSSGAPLPNICVSAPLASSGSSLFRVNTAANGTYLITGLAAGTYKVKFEDCVAPVDYVPEYYDNKADFTSGNTVSVTAGATTSGINAGIAAAGSISGTVVADSTGSPLAGICVFPFPSSGGSNIVSATTAVDGTYIIAGVAAGSYRVKFQDCQSPIDYAAEYYNDAPDPNSSTLVSVSVNTTASGINAGLAIGGSISGTVVADSNGAPLANICVSAPQASTGSSLFRVNTAADGTYLITGLAVGTYKVKFEDCVGPVGYAQEYHDNQFDFGSGNTVSVTAGATTSGINAGIAAGGSISGTVVRDSNGTTLGGICVYPSMTLNGLAGRATTSAVDGTYLISGVPVGTYKVRFQDCSGPIDYAIEYYDDKPDFDSANVVSVTAGATTSGINAGLAPSANISGTVVADGTGTPLGGICVYAPIPSTGVSLVKVTTGADGTYLIKGLATGAYKVQFEDCVSPFDHATEYYDNKPDFTSGNSVSVTAGATTSGINAGLGATHTSAKMPADFDGDGDTDRSVYRDGAWFAEGQATAFIGNATDIPVPGDYDNDGRADKAVYREGAWFTEGQATAFVGNSSDIPVPGDYNGDGRTERAVYRPSVGGWYVEGQSPEFFGLSSDIPVPGDYDGNGTTDIAVFRPSVGGWYIAGQATVFSGLSGDIPVPGDYDGNGTTDKAVFRSSVGGWYIAGQATVFSGLSGDIPVPGDYDGNGTSDKAIWRKAVGGWYVAGQETAFLGLSSDIPLPLPQAVYRQFFTP